MSTQRVVQKRKADQIAPSARKFQGKPQSSLKKVKYIVEIPIHILKMPKEEKMEMLTLFLQETGVLQEDEKVSHQYADEAQAQTKAEVKAEEDAEDAEIQYILNEVRTIPSSHLIFDDFGII